MEQIAGGRAGVCPDVCMDGTDIKTGVGAYHFVFSSVFKNPNA